MAKKLYICCYDISNAKIRAKVYNTIKAHQCGGQYSAYECYLSKKQKKVLEKKLFRLVEKSDCVTLQVIHNLDGIISLGRASAPVNPLFMYVD